MIPPEIETEIMAEFPDIKLMSYEGDFLNGFGVEILTHGRLLRNGWVVSNEKPDWQTVKNDALQWLRQVTSDG